MADMARAGVAEQMAGGASCPSKLEMSNYNCAPIAATHELSPQAPSAASYRPPGTGLRRPSNVMGL